MYYYHHYPRRYLDYLDDYDSLYLPYSKAIVKSGDLYPFYSAFNDRHYTRVIRALPSNIPQEEKDFINRVRARSSSPRRVFSVEPLEGLERAARSSSVPPAERIIAQAPFTAKVVRYTPKIGYHPSPTYRYVSKLPIEPAYEDMESTPKRMYSAAPMSTGPRMYTGLSVFPTMRHSSYNLMAPIDRYRYRTSAAKMTPSSPASYYSYPTPTTSTSSAYRNSDLYPTRHQIQRVTEPSMERIHAAHRTLY